MKKFLALVIIAAMSCGVISTSYAQTKKDGTKDMRYKANKKPKGPVTKSGKPDMRYKSNNPAAGKKKKS